jgi:hypothetical protein
VFSPRTPLFVLAAGLFLLAGPEPASAQRPTKAAAKPSAQRHQKPAGTASRANRQTRPPRRHATESGPGLRRGHRTDRKAPARATRPSTSTSTSTSTRPTTRPARTRPAARERARAERARARARTRADRTADLRAGEQTAQPTSVPAPRTRRVRERAAVERVRERVRPSLPVSANVDVRVAETQLEVADGNPLVGGVPLEILVRPELPRNAGFLRRLLASFSPATNRRVYVTVDQNGVATVQADRPDTLQARARRAVSALVTDLSRFAENRGATRTPMVTPLPSDAPGPRKTRSEPIVKPLPQTEPIVTPLATASR